MSRLGAARPLLAGAGLLVAGTALGTGLGLLLDRDDRAGLQARASAPQLGPPASALPPPLGPPTDVLDERDRLRLNGIGPVRVGSTVAEASAAAGRPLRVTTSGDCTVAQPQDGVPDVLMLVERDRVVRVDVPPGSPVQTLSGAALGSTVAQVRALYGTRLEQDGTDLRFVADDTRYGLVLETDGDRVTGVRAGLAAAVAAGRCPQTARQPAR